ncbi:GNAT family N-acetyltransferase [Metabacillus indicus]|uniref:GNAT family N-acetyltransferase n=1 Tax=Metabacillus indicus TaxID=246786 RepID=UPI00316BF396
MKIRQVEGRDYYAISPLIDEWWGGRHMSDMLPKLFFDHFTRTSFVAEREGEIIGFLIGFLSQTHSNEAYIHFAGVHPDYRKHSIGKKLYNEFFNEARKNGRTIVRCVTSPVNKVSVAYHTKLGFQIEKGDKTLNGLSITTNYDGQNQDRVLFVKELV